MPVELRYPDPPIVTDRFRLRPWRLSDAPAVFEACQDAEIQHFIPEIPRPYTRESAEWFVGRAGQDVAAGARIPMAIAEVERDVAIGSITLHAPHDWHWSIGYWLAPGWRGRGIVTGAVTRFARWAFEANPMLARLSLFTLPDNVASQTVAERAGFTREGTLRRWDHGRGTPVDVVMFSLIRDDLEARR